MLRLYINENFELPVARRLAADGHDVRYAAEDGAGRADFEILRTAVAQGRIIVTHDRDYGRLIFRDEAQGLRGVILVRLRERRVEALAEKMSWCMDQLREEPWDHFVVISNQGIRRTPMPGRRRKA